MKFLRKVDDLIGVRGLRFLWGGDLLFILFYLFNQVIWKARLWSLMLDN